jgi:glyoxylase-like metal-dependent hydrolase (beta-lactamase superfamily II)
VRVIVLAVPFRNAMTPADEIHRVSPILSVWQAYEPAVKCDLTSAALRIDERLILIDPIPIAADAMEELLAEGTPALIVCTNANHARGAGEFRRRFGVKVVAHREAADGLEVDADEWIEDGTRLLDAVDVQEVPGASPGEIALQFGEVVCLGDAVIHVPDHGFALLPEKYCTDAKLLRHSLRNLLRWQFSVLTFAHGLPLTTQAHGRLASLLD